MYIQIFYEAYLFVHRNSPPLQWPGLCSEHSTDGAQVPQMTGSSAPDKKGERWSFFRGRWWFYWANWWFSREHDSFTGKNGDLSNSREWMGISLITMTWIIPSFPVFSTSK